MKKNVCRNSTSKVKESKVNKSKVNKSKVNTYFDSEK